MSACVSPPQDSVSHMVDVAAIIAHAASTALPPFWKIIAPAAAASGLPVIAIQCWPCSGGFCVRWAAAVKGSVSVAATMSAQIAALIILFELIASPFVLLGRCGKHTADILLRLTRPTFAYRRRSLPLNS